MFKLGHFFESFLKKESIFLDKNVLLSSYVPEDILYREEQQQEIANILAPALRMERPSNLFIYGKTGTGKTLTVRQILISMEEVAKQNNILLKSIYLNCKLKKVSDTEYRILAELIKKLGGSVPATGLPTDQVYNRFIDLIDNEKKLIIIIFDEIDHAVDKISDNFLYNLTRLNSELSKSKICVVGISNNTNFLNDVNPRVKSSLSEEEIVFPPYNAIQLQDTLKERAKLAFRKNVIEEGVIEQNNIVIIAGIPTAQVSILHE